MKEIWIFVIITLCGMIMGWSLNEIYDYKVYQKEFAGFLTLNRTWDEAHDTAKAVDKYGDWVCINVRDMTFDDAVETCQHEAGHEIFAEIIEDHPDKIVEVINLVQNG